MRARGEKRVQFDISEEILTPDRISSAGGVPYEQPAGIPGPSGQQKEARKSRRQDSPSNDPALQSSNHGQHPGAPELTTPAATQPSGSGTKTGNKSAHTKSRE